MGNKVQIEVLDTPIRMGPASLPVDWLGDWLRETHGDGRRRGHAVAEIYERLQHLGLRGCALVGGDWLTRDPERPGIVREGPEDVDGVALWADVAGAFPPGWWREVCREVLRVSPRPSEVPVAWSVAHPFGRGVVIDPSLAGRRPGLVIAAIGEGVSEQLPGMMAEMGVGWLVLGASGLLRGDQFRTHWERLGRLLVSQPVAPPTEPPVNPQEVVARVSDALGRLCVEAQETFEAATVTVFLPDPDDEYVYSLSAAGSATYAYDAAVVPDKPDIASVGFGLTAAMAMGAAFDPRGGPLALRVFERRDEILARYRDLGFEEGDVGVFQAERFVDETLVDEARRGPWVLTAQQLPRALSPSGRNLVVRYQGRVIAPQWATEEERSRVTLDRKSRLATASQRLYSDACHLLTEGLARWRSGLRDEVLRHLAGPQTDLDELCQAMAVWTSARHITLFERTGEGLRLAGWSGPGPRPELLYDIDAEPLSARELRLLHAPLYPRRGTITSEGFLRWEQLLAHFGAEPENTGTVPLVAGNTPLGVLRIDGAMSLFGGHIPRRSPQKALCHHRPTVTPHHLRGALEDVARVVSLALGTNAGDGPAELEVRWSQLIARVRQGLCDESEVTTMIVELRRHARTRAAAADLVGVHRNTFRRQLAVLAEIAGEEAVVW